MANSEEISILTFADNSSSCFSLLEGFLKYVLSESIRSKLPMRSQLDGNNFWYSYDTGQNASLHQIQIGKYSKKKAKDKLLLTIEFCIRTKNITGFVIEPRLIAAMTGEGSAFGIYSAIYSRISGIVGSYAGVKASLSLSGSNGKTYFVF